MLCVCCLWTVSWKTRQRPNHVLELRSFLGFASYYRRFVEGFAKLASWLQVQVGVWAGHGCGVDFRV